MNRRRRSTILSLCLTLGSPMVCIEAKKTHQQEAIQETLDTKLPEKKEKKQSSHKKISFDFDAAELVDIINMIAAEKNVNVILPIGANAITNKVTLRMENQVTLEQAWQLLHTLLEVAGYTMIQKETTYTIVKITPNVSREPAPIYVNTELDEIPNFEKRITYISYLSHIKVPRLGGEAQSELDGILKTLLSTTALIKYEAFTNALIVNDNANNIKSALAIIKELDKPGFEESFEIIRLRYSQADIVADLFNKSILAATDPKTRLTIRKPSEAMYFPQGTRIIPESRTNSLFVIGARQAIERVKDFILKYVDVELGSGKSILHTYQLQYLDADSFAQVLENIVKSAGTGGTGQSKAAAAGGTGPERFFEDVTITTDKPKAARGATPGQSPDYYGSNKLIIAARNDDWERIKKIIEELDSPQPQVIIEVLIADLTLADDRVLGSMMRNPKAIPLPRLGDSIRSMEFQSEQLIPGQIATNMNSAGDFTIPADTTIDADLGKFNGIVNGKAGQAVNLLAGLTPGSTAVTIADDDGSVWSILQVLQSYGQAKILSHPHVIATNNKEALVKIGEQRLVTGQAVGSTGGATTAKNEFVEATLVVKLTPRISSAKTVNLSLSIDIEDFTSADNLSNANRATRTIKTNANVLSTDILALGGLIKVNTGTAVNETPILGKIPILGWFFKRREGVNTKTNLTVFIRPTIIEPRLRGGINEYTKDYIQLAQDYVKEGMLFDTMRDPVTRWFFKTGADTDEAINLFLEQNKEPEKIFDAPLVEVTDAQNIGTEAIELKKQCTEPLKQGESCTAAIPHDRAEHVKKLTQDLANPLIATKQQTNNPVVNG